MFTVTIHRPDKITCMPGASLLKALPMMYLPANLLHFVTVLTVNIFCYNFSGAGLWDLCL